MASKRVSLDCSFLAHALVPSQQTDDAITALEMMLRDDWTLLATPVVYAEFPGVVLKLRNRGLLNEFHLERSYRTFRRLPLRVVPLSNVLLDRAWEISYRLGQPTIFDAIGYAAAEANDAEFWTSDKRFYNAVETHGLSSGVFVA